MSENKRMSSSRRQHLKSLMLQVAAKMLAEEEAEMEAAKERYMAENCPALSTSGSTQELLDMCKKLLQKCDKADEERYDVSAKVEKTDKEIDSLKVEVVALVSKFKKPALKKVRMSADAMLQALLGPKRNNNMDLRANLKQVKKEVKEEDKESAGDWRKNIEDKSDRKKMFETS